MVNCMTAIVSLVKCIRIQIMLSHCIQKFSSNKFCLTGNFYSMFFCNIKLSLDWSATKDEISKRQLGIIVFEYGLELTILIKSLLVSCVIHNPKGRHWCRSKGNNRTTYDCEKWIHRSFKFSTGPSIVKILLHEIESPIWLLFKTKYPYFPIF